MRLHNYLLKHTYIGSGWVFTHTYCPSILIVYYNIERRCRKTDILSQFGPHIQCDCKFHWNIRSGWVFTHTYCRKEVKSVGLIMLSQSVKGNHTALFIAFSHSTLITELAPPLVSLHRQENYIKIVQQLKKNNIHFSLIRSWHIWTCALLSFHTHSNTLDVRR